MDPSAKTEVMRRDFELAGELANWHPEPFTGSKFALFVDQSVGLRSAPAMTGMFSAPVFLVQKDWGALLQQIPGADDGEFQAPFDDCIFEFMVGGRRVLAHVETREAEDPKIACQVFFFDAAHDWFVSYSLYYLVGPTWHHASTVRAGALGLIELIANQVRAVSILTEAGALEVLDVDAPERLNRARIKRGAVPLNGYKEFHLHERVRGTAAKPYQGVVRCHLRRGHYANMRGRRVWRKWALVGNPDLGFVANPYRMGARP